MHGEFSRSFPDYSIFFIFFCKCKTDECFLFINRFSFRSWRHLKIVISKAHYDYNYSYNLHFLSYVISDQSWKLLAENSQTPPDKIQCPHHLKFQKVKVTPFLGTLKLFCHLPPPPALPKGWGGETRLCSKCPNFQ